MPRLDPESTALLERLTRKRSSVHTMAPEEARRVIEREAPAPDPAWPGEESADVIAGVPVSRFVPDGPTNGSIAFAHGGGWIHGSPRTHALLCQHLATATKREVVSVDYRLAPEHPFPAAVIDVRAVLHGMLTHADDVILAGDSAGGHVAIGAALTYPSRARHVSGLIMFYPVVTTDLEIGIDPELDGLVLSREELTWHRDHYFQSVRHRESPAGSPLTAPDLSVLPPVVLVVAGQDPIGVQSRLLAEALGRAGVPCDLLEYPGTFHGFCQYPDVLQTAQEAIAETARAIASKSPSSASLPSSHFPQSTWRSVDERTAFSSTAPVSTTLANPYDCQPVDPLPPLQGLEHCGKLRKRFEGRRNTGRE